MEAPRIGLWDIAQNRGAKTVRTEPGRGRQMNAGARALEAPWVLFLHADSRLPPETREALCRWLDTPPPCEAAHFAFRLDQEGFWWGLIERGQRVRERLTGLTYGDQGLLLSRSLYEELDGIPETPLMEDVEIVRRLRRNGGLDRIDAPVITSARRYLREGPFRALVRERGLDLSLLARRLAARSVPLTQAPRWHLKRPGASSWSSRKRLPPDRSRPGSRKSSEQPQRPISIAGSADGWCGSFEAGTIAW